MLKKLSIIRTPACSSRRSDSHIEHIAFTSQVEYNAFSSGYTTAYKLLTIKFFISITSLKQLEFTTPAAVSMFTPGFLPALNHMHFLTVLYRQGLEEMILNSIQFKDADRINEFFIRLRDLSHSYGTTFMMSSEN